MGDGCLNNEHFEELGGILKGKLEEHFKNQELRQGKLIQIPVDVSIWLFFKAEFLIISEHKKSLVQISLIYIFM